MLLRHIVLFCTVVIVKRKKYKKPYSLNIEINIWNSRYYQYTYSNREGEGGELNLREGRVATGESADHKAWLKIPT